MFFEICFPNSIAIRSTAIIDFNTSIVVSKNGKEQRIANRENGKMIFNISNGIKTKKDLEEIITFFRIVKGKSNGFRFKDWLDFKVVDQTIGFGNNQEKTFQLIKTYNIFADKNNVACIRKITKPVLNTLKIFINNEEVDNSLINLNKESGKITFQSAPKDGDVITANFEFDVPVRFESDMLEFGLDTQNTGKIKDIKLIEIF